VTDNSDYTKPHTKLFELLPEVYQSDTNRSLFANLFDRYLTKQETSRVAGYVGQGNPNAVVSRQIHEVDVHRQAYQLQPILYNKVGSVEWISSWKDILNEAERQGVDPALIQEWLSLMKFNWVPPVDIDKIVNYQDYYWYDEENIGPPQYVTIRSRCTTANSLITFYEGLISEYGGSFEILDLASSQGNGEYDTLVIAGNYTRPLEVGFEFYITGSTNIDLNDAFWIIVDSEYNSINGNTYVKINTTTTVPGGDGFISLYEKLAAVTADASNQCTSGQKSVISSADQWIALNKWLHKTDVPNFSIARQADIPIIEYDWDLELNEWSYTEYKWKYRKYDAFDFESVDASPNYIEIVPLRIFQLDGGPNKLILDERYGDLSDYFIPGRQFYIEEITQILEVSESLYSTLVDGQPMNTRITLTEDIVVPVGFTFGDINAGTESMFNGDPVAMIPDTTCIGDQWKGFNEHWVLTEYESVTAMVHQPEHPLSTIDIVANPPIPSGGYETSYNYLVQYYAVTASTNDTFVLDDTVLAGTSKSLRQRSLWGTNTTRVYVNGVRQYGTYEEKTEKNLSAGSPQTGDDVYVAGIVFLAGYIPVQDDIVIIKVGSSTISDYGLTEVQVRMEENDLLFNPSTIPTKTLIHYRKEDQVKTQRNQYPIFDLYNVDGSPAHKATAIFEYQTDSNADVNVSIGQRLKTDGELNYVFKQSLVDDDGDILYAYRDYFNHDNLYWVDTSTNIVYFWVDNCWTRKINVNGNYIAAVVSDEAPVSPIVGAYWLDTLENKLKVQTSLLTWDEVIDVTYTNGDPTLQTIWKKGLNNETYIPQKRDDRKRSEEEYNEEKSLFFEERIQELVITGITLADATAQTQSEWNLKETNHLSQFDGNGNVIWYGDWELPDPLYYNHSHENRNEVSLSEVVTHFNSIIDSQPRIPGYTGSAKGMFHLINSNDVNPGLGGTIREYQYGFDTFLSSLFIDEISPRSLITFGHDQYEVLINTLKELFRANMFELLTDTSDASLTDLSSEASKYVINLFEQNDQLSQIYGDSTTFIDNTDGDDIGIRNWIATLPFLCLSKKHIPSKVSDPDRGLNHIVHHDGHREDYFLADATIENINFSITQVEDARVAPNKLGVVSTNQPPNTVADFVSEYGTEITHRAGVYWYQNDGSNRILYRLSVLSIGDAVPSDTLADGSLWLDLTTGAEVLRIKRRDDITGDVVWDVPQGLTVGASPIKLHNGAGDNDTASVSAWEVVDLNEILRDIIFDVEMKLYEVAPNCNGFKYDYDAIKDQYPTRYNQYLEEQFLAFIREREITTPYSNIFYDSSNPFTWNYKYSTQGTGHKIIDIDVTNNAFVIEDDYIISFTAGETFYIKNNGDNDGKWEVVSSTVIFSGTADEATKIYVTETVQNATIGGVIYRGTLPSNFNDGSESGGDWKDVYQKFYGTPFPHLEPWSLQGYEDKPLWWDEEYLNDDTLKWGDRRWKYKHGFEILSANENTEEVTIDGDFREVFLKGIVFQIDGGSPHDGSWTVGSLGDVVGGAPGVAGTASLEIDGDHVVIFAPNVGFAVQDGSDNFKQLLTVENSYYTGLPTNKTIIFVKEEIETLTDYVYFSGSFYNQVSNTTTIRVDGDITLDTTNEGRITLATGGYGMWNNIINGIIPQGRPYPNGLLTDTIPSSIPTYSYVSVNIGNTTINHGGEYTPDEVFAPYWEFSSYFGYEPLPGDIDRAVRSLFYLYSTEIVAPAADYVFGDSGPYEWWWRESSQYLYDQLTIAYRLDPVRVMHSIYTAGYHTVGGLLIDKDLKKLLSHSDVEFHGDIIDNEVYKINSVNQWYVNYLRYSDFDISMSDFRTKWKDWTAPMMYQFASFIDTPSLDLAHRQICISDFDYRVTSKRAPGVEDYWLDSFNINILQSPPKVAQQNNEHAWKLSLTTKTPFTNTIEYYDVQNYQFYVDPDSDICTLFSWDISYIDFFNNTFTIKGDQTHLFDDGDTMELVESSDVAINGLYNVVVSTYNVIDDTTIITVQESLPATSVNDGRIILDKRSLPWETGENIILTSHGFLPTPLKTDNVNGVYEYFIIKLTDNTFRLALTANDAYNNLYVDITSGTVNDIFVGKIQTTFSDNSQPVFWKHYALDKSSVLSFIPPYEFSGLQQLINIVDGYAAYAYDGGWRFNVDNTLRDPSNTALAVNWQHELIRFMDYAYNVRLNTRKVGERYPVTINESTNVWTLTGEGRPQFITGDPITVVSSNHVYPTPLFHGGRYYMIRDSVGECRLAATKTDALQGNEIDISVTAGIRDLYLTNAETLNVSSASFELNPFRNAVWFRPTRGVVSDLLKGPTDAFSSHILVDQYGRAMTQNNVRVYREDRETKIAIADGITNDVELTTLYQDPYNFIHLGAAHLFVDTYEHVLIFNDETTEGQLIYDSFLGLNLTKFEMLFNRQEEFTQRPNVGGQYLKTFFNQGADLERNIEASVEDLRNLYDTYRVIEANELIALGRKSIGYEKEGTHFDNLNINDKSQFIFWRGQIQHKGAVTSIQAFINSRRFIDAKIDEYWAVKVGEFGTDSEKEYIDMWLSTDDVTNDDIYVRFIGDTDSCDAGYDTNAYDIGCGYSFPNTESGDLSNGVGVVDEDRWYEYPDQQEELKDNLGLFYFNVVPTNAVPIVAISNIAPLEPNHNDGWIDITDINGSPSLTLFKRWNEGTDTWDIHGRWSANEPYLRHDMKADLITITATITPTSWSTGSPFYPTLNERYCDIVGVSGNEVVIPEYVPGTGMLKLFKATGSPTGTGENFSGEQMVRETDYVENFGNGFYSTIITVTEALSADDVIRVVYSDTCTFLRDIHYEQFNTNIVKLLFDGMVSETDVTNLKLWGWNFDKDALNPHKIIDVKSNTTITPITIWDPARSWHYYNADHIIDLRLDIDPALYNNSPVSEEVQLEIIAQEPLGDLSEPNKGDRTAEQYWGKTRVGTTMLDTRNLDYVPYYDPAIIPNLSDRLFVWGQLADWSDLKIYTWVESDVHPEEWNDLAVSEETDLAIPQQSRKAGRVYKQLFEHTDINGFIPAKPINETLDFIVDQIGTDTYMLNKHTPYTETIIASEGTVGSPLGSPYVITFNNFYKYRTQVGAEVDINGTVFSIVDIDGDSIANTTTITVTGSSIPMVGNIITFYQPVHVYRNGSLYSANVPVSPSGEIIISDLNEVDRINVIRSIPVDQTIIDEEVEAGMLAQEYQYTTEPYVDDLGNLQNRYYFWVEDKATKGEKTMSPLNAQTSMINFPIPYIVYDNVIQGGDIILADGSVGYLPPRFVNSVLRGLRTVVDDNNRYIIRWTRDYSLRDELISNSLDKKDVHEQWEMIRREMPYNVPQWLWNKVTESMVGYLLTDSTSRVPTYQREIYDLENGTQTQYGIGTGQAFTDGELAKDTILTYLNDPENDFTPIDINVFFSQYNFDTNADIVQAMEYIYNNFPYLHVNAMFFEVLLDAFSKKTKYEGIFKTSMISVYGIRPMEVSGLFDTD
jgi:hypothetical protein